MGGFFGVISENDCVADLFYGTDYHSHLGTKRAGMAVTDRNGIIRRFIHDITNAQFRSKFDSDLPKLAGKCGVGVISDMEDQPLVICSHLGTYAIVTVGKINNIDELAEDLFNHGQSHFAEMSTGEYNPTEVIASLINIKPTVEEGIAYAQEVIDGSCSVLLMLDNTLYAARDRYGRTPVVIGKRNGAHAVAMESTALPNLDFDTECELGPGEIVKLTADEKIQLKAPGECLQFCSFFWVYFG